MVHICDRILLSHKKDELIPFVTTWLKLDGIMLISQMEKEKELFHSYVEYKTKNSKLTKQKTNLWQLPEGKVVGGQRRSNI